MSSGRLPSIVSADCVHPHQPKACPRSHGRDHGLWQAARGQAKRFLEPFCPATCQKKESHPKPRGCGNGRQRQTARALINRHSWCMLRRSVRAGRGRSAVVELAGLAHVQRSRAHQAHVALADVPQLRQLIEARLAKPWTQARQARGVGRAGTGAERVSTGQPTSRAAAETATSMSRLIARPAGLISLPRPVDRPPSPVRVRRDRSPRKRFRTALAARAPPSRRACTPDGPIQ